MHAVSVKMELAVQQTNLAQGDAKRTLTKWGDSIRNQFDIDNLRLVHRQADTGSAQVRFVYVVEHQVSQIPICVGVFNLFHCDNSACNST
jgi:hypothetical protein